MLPTDSKTRKERPMHAGLLKYFPDALAYIAHVSYVGNEKHNPGEPLHWSRGKSSDHGDCIVRHQAEAGGVDDDGLLHSGKVAWRACAQLQIELEAADGPVPDFRTVPIAEVPRLDEDVRGTYGFQLPKPTDTITWRNFAEIHEPRIIKGCPKDVETQIINGITWPAVKDANGITVYIAGPMRGIKGNNFPTFDAARDALVKQGYTVISPADIDRFAEPERDPSQIKDEDQTRFVIRDTFALCYLKQLGHPDNGVVLLNNWYNSKGASAERATGIWLELKRYCFNTTFGDISEMV